MNNLDNKQMMIISHKCDICENSFDINIQNLQVGDIIECPICGSTLEVVNIEKNKLQTSPIVKGK